MKTRGLDPEAAAATCSAAALIILLLVRKGGAASLRPLSFLIALAAAVASLAWLLLSSPRCAMEGFNQTASATDIGGGGGDAGGDASMFGGALDGVLLPALDRLTKGVYPQQGQQQQSTERSVSLADDVLFKDLPDSVKREVKKSALLLCMMKGVDVGKAERVYKLIDMLPPEMDDEGQGTPEPPADDPGPA